MEETLLLLRFNCPYDGCAHMGHDWPSLEKHTLAVHGLVLCSLCRRQLSRFAHEQILYPPHLLPLHDPSRVLRGQRPPRPRGDEVELVKTWEAPHPVCEVSSHCRGGVSELTSSSVTRRSLDRTSCSSTCARGMKSVLCVANWEKRMFSESWDVGE